MYLCGASQRKLAETDSCTYTVMVKNGLRFAAVLVITGPVCWDVRRPTRRDAQQTERGNGRSQKSVVVALGVGAPAVKLASVVGDLTSELTDRRKLVGEKGRQRAADK